MGRSALIKTVQVDGEEEAGAKASGSQTLLRGLDVIDALIERLKSDPRLISLFYKNFSWKGIMNSLPREEVRSPIIERLSKGRSSRNFEMTSFVILELVFSVLYGSIVLGDASEVEEIKPFLLHSVSRLLAKDT